MVNENIRRIVDVNSVIKLDTPLRQNFRILIKVLYKYVLKVIRL